MISTLQKLTGLGSDIAHTSGSSINFNANLPVTVEVIKQIDPTRYRLKIGRKELTTKSTQNLKERQKYWANFSEQQGGILTISTLWKQPKLFENEEYFLPLSLENLFESKEFSYGDFKAFLMKQLSEKSISKTLFTTYGYMLLALSKATIHIPLIHEGKKVMVQFQKQSNETLLFYCAFEHLGPLCGIMSPKELQIATMYEKSFQYLQKQSAKLDMITDLTHKKEIKPLFDVNDLVLDLKG